MCRGGNLGSVRVYFKSQEGSQASDVVAALVNNFGARITCHDWYADMRRTVQEIILWQENAGKPISDPQRILGDIDQADREAGLRVGVAVPMEGGGYMIGDITAERLVLTACCSLKERESVKRLVAFLRAVAIVSEVEVT